MMARAHLARLGDCEDGFCPSLSQDTWDAVILESLGQLMREFVQVRSVLSLSSVWVQADGATVHSHDGNGKREHSKTSTGTKTPYQWHMGQRANLFVSWGRIPSKCINALSQPLVCAAFTILSHGHGKERKINLMAEKLGKHPIGQVTRETSH